MEHRLGVRVRWIGLALALLGLASPALAQHPEKVAVFAISHGAASADLQATAAIVQQQIREDGKQSVRADILPAPTSDQELLLADARTVGHVVFNELADGRDPGAVIGEYGKRIDLALDTVSWVKGEEGRALLWNLCALRVHLLLLGASSTEGSDARESVLDCRRRFVDRSQPGATWVAEVVRAFERVSTEVAPVQLAVRTTPAGCTLSLYGAAVGSTPTTLDVIPGPQELQVECGGRSSAIHRVTVRGSQELVINLQADGALSERDGVATLRYRSPSEEQSALEHARAFADEAQADSVVLVKSGARDQIQIEWLRVPSGVLGAAELDGAATRDATIAKLQRLFRGPRDSADSVVPRDRPAPPERTLADSLVGVGALATGVAVGIVPVIGLVSHNSKDFGGSKTMAAVGVGVAAALVVSGGVVLWRRPFGRRAALSVGVGNVSFAGRF